MSARSFSSVLPVSFSSPNISSSCGLGGSEAREVAQHLMRHMDAFVDREDREQAQRLVQCLEGIQGVLNQLLGEDCGSAGWALLCV